MLRQHFIASICIIFSQLILHFLVNMSKYMCISSLTSQGISKETMVLHFKIGISYYRHLKVHRVIKESVVQSLGIPVFYDYRHSAHRQNCLLCFSRVERKDSDLTNIQRGTSDTTRLFFSHSILYGIPPHSYRVDLEMHEEIQQTVLSFQ